MPDLESQPSGEQFVEQLGRKTSKNGEILQENPSMTCPTQSPTAPLAQPHFACARAQGCLTPTVFQKYQGKTDLKARMKVAITHATENVGYSNIPGSYSNLSNIQCHTMERQLKIVSC